MSDSSSDSSDSEEVFEGVQQLTSSSHVALYISALGGGNPVKFLVSTSTSFESLLSVVKAKFGVDQDDVDIAVTNSLDKGASLALRDLLFARLHVVLSLH